MAVIFYLLGWIGILYGVGTAGYRVFGDIQSILRATASSQNSVMTDILKYLTSGDLVVPNFLASASPGLGMFFAGLLLLAVGGVLARLSEIAYNTRNG